jgi:hypothetical protein
MKTIKNTIHFRYEIGTELAYIAEEDNEFSNGGLVVEAFEQCPVPCDCESCSGYRFTDEYGHEWCDVEGDFEEV